MNARPHKFYHHQHQRHRGYVLMLTLVLLALAALALLAVSRAALRRIQSAGEAQSDLQRRWGALSCQSAILPKAAKLLEQAQSDDKPPVISLNQSLVLGNQTFELTIGDESAKANVTMLIERQGQDQAELTLRRLSLSSPELAAHVHLRWMADRKGPASFGEVFDDLAPASLQESSFGAPAVRLLTCWGDGKANIHRASDRILREIGNGVLDGNQIQKLMDMQQAKPPLSLNRALDALQLSAKNRAAAETILSDSSTCFSLWIKCINGRREDYSLAVIDQSKPTPRWNWYEW